MVRTIQRKITSIYSLWLFAVFILFVAYLLVTGQIFMTYADAKPWILAYILLAIIGNIGALIAMYYYLIVNSESLKRIAVYEVLFLFVFILAYWIVAAEMLPNAIGNINFETLLNAVLPIAFIFLTFIEVIFSKAIRSMTPKPENSKFVVNTRTSD